MNEFAKYIAILPIILLSFAASILLIHPVIKLATLIGAVSKPRNLRDNNERGYTTHIHDKITPKLGFLPVIIPLLVISPFFLKIDFHIFSIFVAIGVMTIFGIIDDKYNVSGPIQFLVLSVCCLIVIFSGINITEANNPFTDTFINFNRGRIHFFILDTNISFSILSAGITFLWLMIVINAINWNDGVDGVLNGNVAIAALIIMLVSIREFNAPTAILSAILFGTNIGLLKYNFYPAKIFNSYGGQISGFMIGILAITSNVKLSIAILIILFPLMDFVWVLVGRIKRLKPRSIKQLLLILNVSDTTHLHHRLLSLGYSKRKVAVIEYFLASTAGLLAILLSGLELTFFIFSSVLLVLLIFFLLDRIIKKKTLLNK